MAYSQSDMVSKGIGNDQTTSVMVPYGYAVDLYNEDGFRGDKKSITGTFY